MRIRTLSLFMQEPAITDAVNIAYIYYNTIMFIVNFIRTSSKTVKPSAWVCGRQHQTLVTSTWVCCRHYQTLVTSNWLRDQLFIGSSSPPKVRILDASWQLDGQGYEKLYKIAHIPQAVHFDLYQCTTRTKEIPVQLPEIKCWTEYVQSLGISSDTHVIVYDGQKMWAALRAWWLFRLHGHEKVSVLDGGLNKWAKDGYEITTEEPVVQPSDFKCNLNTSLLRTFEDVKENLYKKSEQLIDCRDLESFDGSIMDKPPESRDGHIPGSLNIPYEELFNDNMTFKSDDELQEIFEDAGVDLDKPMVTCCFIGISACGINAAAHILGKPNVAVYYGSWNEWRLRADESLCETGKPRQKM